MHRLHTSLVLAAVAGIVLLFTSSCQKEQLQPASPSVLNTSSGEGWAAFDAFGPQLEEAFSYAVADREFGRQISVLALEMRDGDTEVLLSRLLETPYASGKSAREHLLGHADGIFTADELDAFLKAYPSTIVGVRGNTEGWARNADYVPPVRFVETTFNEKDRTATATRQGAEVSLDMVQPFADAVIAIHRSERHSPAGDLLIIPDNALLTRQAPGTSLDDLEDVQEVQSLCGPEPQACPSTLPTVNSFTAVPVNGGIQLSYSVSNFPSSLCRWGRVKVTRFNPNGTTTTWRRFADDPNFFYDTSGGYNTTYTYRIDVYIARTGVHPTYPNSWQWYTCPANNNLLTATATYPGAGPILDSYVGRNISSTSIRYDWSPPSGTPVAEYRIRKAQMGGYAILNGSIPASTTNYFMNVPSGDRGRLVETQIQYRSGGPWQGSFYDRTYASYRNPGRPLKYYGIEMVNVSSYEVGENNFFGAPEVRLLAMQGTANGSNITLAETLIPMSPCLQTIFLEPFNFPYTVNTGYFFPTQAPDGFTILNQWNADLAGTAIRVMTKESDISEVVITTSTNVQSTSTTLSAEFGLKIKEIFTADAGIESTFSNTNTRNYRYPTGDLSLGNTIIYYHEHPVTVRNNQLFGDIFSNNRCLRLMDYL